MTESRNETLDETDFDIVLSNDIDFSGTARLEKPFLARGKITGEILSTSLLVIDEHAVVDADITAPHVVIRGTVKGNVTASEKIHITLTGKLQGNIATTEICMEAGCLFNGRCSMTGNPSPSVQETAPKL
jgi:cytoskeletal protein CcmA (bactofilin family)